MSKKSLWNGSEWVKGSVIKKEVVATAALNSSQKVEKLINNNISIINQLHKDIEQEKNFIVSKCSKNKKGIHIYQDFKREKPEDVMNIKSRREKTDAKLAQENITKLFTKIIMLS